MESRKTNQRAESKATEALFSAQVATERYQEAINDVAMDQKKSKIIRELTLLHIADRQRKQTNATILGAPVAYTKEFDLVEKFTKEFKLETTKDISTRSKISTNRNIANDSFEFTMEAVELIRK